MPSQIKVDEIKNVAGQYEIKTNTFKGQTTAGSIAVQGEGTATTNLQQGLAKAWANLNGSSFGLRDNFNMSSATDNGTGNYTLGFTNNMSDSNYCSTPGGHTSNANANSTQHIYVTEFSTSTLRIKCNDSGGTAQDWTLTATSVQGDLA